MKKEKRRRKSHTMLDVCKRESVKSVRERQVDKVEARGSTWM